MRFFKLGKINIKELITYNFWLKVVSLILAISVWLYVSNEITKGVKI
ncbi:MAG: hypothetical protein PHP17_01565 [Candidatus Omnitrophica bacterium]|nr:hypothetical protein [Candidatus Omnitrophota bacterium]